MKTTVEVNALAAQIAALITAAQVAATPPPRAPQVPLFTVPEAAKPVDGAGRRCIVNGNTRSLYLLGRALEHDLPIVCEGVRAGLPSSRARQLGLGFVELYLVGKDVNRGDEVQILRLRRELSTYYPLFDFVNPNRGSPTLKARLRVTEDVATDFALGRYPIEVLLEELHTALEQTLRELLPHVHERARWPDLLRRAEKDGLLTSSQEIWMAAVEHSHTDMELLRSLTTLRNASKHRMAEARDAWLVDHWQCVAFLLEGLVRHLGECA